MVSLGAFVLGIKTVTASQFLDNDQCLLDLEYIKITDYII